MIVHKGYRRCDSACCDLAFAKPNPMINTDLLIISCNYLSLICETEILCLPHFYLKCQFLYRISLVPSELRIEFWWYSNWDLPQVLQVLELIGFVLIWSVVWWYWILWLLILKMDHYLTIVFQLLTFE